MAAWDDPVVILGRCVLVSAWESAVAVGSGRCVRAVAFRGHEGAGGVGLDTSPFAGGCLSCLCRWSRAWRLVVCVWPDEVLCPSGVVATKWRGAHMGLLGLLGTRRWGVGSRCAVLEVFIILRLCKVLRLRCGSKNCFSPSNGLSPVVAPAKIRVRWTAFCFVLAHDSGPSAVLRRRNLILVGR